MTEQRINRRLAAVLLFNDNHHVLMQYRGSDAPTSANQWSLPGGGIEQDETPEEAAYREILEETGLCIKEPLQLLWHGILPSVSHPGTYNEWFAFVVHTHTHQEDVIVGEGEAMTFFPLCEAIKVDIPESTRYLLSLVDGSPGCDTSHPASNITLAGSLSAMPSRSKTMQMLCPSTLQR